MPFLSDPIREKIRAYIPRYPSKRAVTLPGAAHRPRAFPLRAVRGDEGDRRDPGVTPAEVHDTMSFYGFFPQAPIGDVRVWICRSISCMLTGGEDMLAHACAIARRHLGADHARRQDHRRVRRVPGDLRLSPPPPWRMTAGSSAR